MPDIAPPLLSLLGASAKQAYNYVRGAVKRSQGVSASLAAYRSGGGKITTQVYGDLYAAVAATADVNRVIRLIGEDAPLPLTAHNRGNTFFAEGANFQYLVGTNSDNPLVPEAIYVNSVNSLSANEIYAKAAASFRYEEGSGMSAQDLGDVTFTIDDARYLPQPQAPLPLSTSGQIARALSGQVPLR